MRPIAIVTTLVATPSYAHHEIVVATSLLPAMIGVVAVVSACLAGVCQKYLRKHGKVLSFNKKKLK